MRKIKLLEQESCALDSAALRQFTVCVATTKCYNTVIRVTAADELEAEEKARRWDCDDILDTYIDSLEERIIHIKEVF